MPGCFEPCGTFHYLLKYYTEGDGWKEKSRRKKLTSVATSLQGGGKKANPTICGRYSCVAVWLNCTSIELMYPLNLDKSSKKHFRKHFFLFCSFFFPLSLIPLSWSRTSGLACFMRWVLICLVCLHCQNAKTSPAVFKKNFFKKFI